MAMKYSSIDGYSRKDGLIIFVRFLANSQELPCFNVTQNKYSRAVFSISNAFSYMDNRCACNKFTLRSAKIHSPSKRNAVLCGLTSHFSACNRLLLKLNLQGWNKSRRLIVRYLQLNSKLNPSFTFYLICRIPAILQK